MIYGIERVWLDGRREEWAVEDRVYEDASAFADAYIRTRHLMIYSASNKLYRRSVIESRGIRFDETLSFGEDRLFNYRFLRACGKAVTSSLVMASNIERSRESLSTRHIPDFFSLVMKLHEEKLVCFPAYGPHTAPDLWYADPEGRAIVLEEFRKLVNLKGTLDEFENA